MPNPTFQAIVSAVNQSGAAFRSVRTDLSAVRREADATRGALVKLDRPGMLSSLSGSTRILGEHFGALNTRVAATGGLLQSLFPVLAGLGAAGSVTGLFALVDKVASSRAEFIATADKIGVTTGALAGLNYAARMNEVPIDAMQLGLTRLNKTMGAAGLGKGKDAAAILQRLGFSLADVKKGTVTAADVLPKLADSFAHTENAALKTWVATTLFGRGGMALIPMLNRGGDAIRQFAEEARQLGYVFTAEDNENLEAYHRSMIRLDTAVHGFVNVVGAELAPVLRPIVDDMALWIRANRDWVATGITGAVKDFSDFMKQQDWSGAAHDVGALASGAGELVTALGGLKTVVEGLVLLKLAGWGISAGAGLLKVAAALDAIAGTTIFAALGAWGIVALVSGAGTGTLVHPFLGERQCRSGLLRWSESKDRGGYAAFDIDFVEDGKQASPLSVTDTAGGLLHGLLQLLPVIKRAYAIASLAAKRPGYLLGFAENLFGQLAESVLGLPPATILGLRSTVVGMAGSFANDDAASDAVLNVFTGAADNVATALAPPALPDDPVSGRVPLLRPGADLTGGLAGLAGWGDGLAAVTHSTPVLAAMAAQQAAIVGLVEAAATVAVLQVYAAIVWPSADAASAALGQVLGIVDARAEAAADAGLDELYLGWQAIGAMAVQDVTQRAQQLPRLARYSLPGSLPSLALAQLLHHDAGRAEELEALNDAPHPAFMPRAGYQLVP